MKSHQSNVFRQHFPSLRAFVATMTLMMGISGCALMHEDGPPAALLAPQQIRLSDDIKLSRDGWPEARWWYRYHDAQLNALIEQAIKDAPTMAIALARVEAGRTQAALVDANRELFVGLSASVNRQELSENGFLGPFSQNIPAEGLTGPRYTEGTIGLVSAYSFDLWGKERAQVDAALGVRNARHAEAAQAELVLSARVTQLYFEIQTLYAMQDLFRQTRAIEAELVAVHIARAERGLEPHTQIELARARKFDVEKQISASESRVAVLRATLRAMLGAGAERLAVIEARPLPEDGGELPESLGYELLARRPDLQAMRWYVQASLSQLDVAKAAFYPSLDIKTFLGFNALHLDDLMHRSSRQINLVPGLSLPIFDSGRLNAGLTNAHAQNNLIVAQYNQSVLNAVREVAQAGIELENLTWQIRLQQAKLDAVRFPLESAQAQHVQGLSDKMAEMEAKLPVLSEQGLLLELSSRQINSAVALTLALGGGFRAEPGQAGRAGGGFPK